MLQQDRFQKSSARALALTRRLIDQFGPRPAGSEASTKCARAIQETADGFSDRAWTETFTVHPGAFLGWIRVLVVVYAIAVACLWAGIPLAAAVLVTAGLSVMVAEFFLYREALDPFFPRRTGVNVFASLDPTDEVRGELIVSGHHDSARVFNFLTHQPALYPVRVYGGIGSLVALFLVSWALTLQTLLGHGTPAWMTGAAIAFSALFVLVGQLWWFASSAHTAGAGDNLASSAAAVEFLRDIATQRAAGEGLRNLRVTAASWDAEEAGLRGSRAWRKARGMRPGGHPVWNLNLECLYESSDFFLLTSDINGSVALSQSLADRCASLLSQAGRPDVPTKPIAFLTGGTDAAETARAGANATTLMGMPWGNSERGAVYHTPADTPESVSE
jgi:aminopeptidase YwaD